MSPSVITLNAIAASHATTEFLLSVVGLKSSKPCWDKFFPLEDVCVEEEPRRDADCRECSEVGRLGAGTLKRLPVKQSGKRTQGGTSG